MVGVPVGGRLGIASENVPNPVAESSPVKISAPIPAASRPGKSTAVAIAPASPDASISRNAAASGVPSSVLIAGEAARAGDYSPPRVRHLADGAHHQIGEAPADRDE